MYVQYMFGQNRKGTEGVGPSPMFNSFSPILFVLLHVYMIMQLSSFLETQ